MFKHVRNMFETCYWEMFWTCYMATGTCLDIIGHERYKAPLPEHVWTSSDCAWLKHVRPWSNNMLHSLSKHGQTCFGYVFGSALGIYMYYHGHGLNITKHQQYIKAPFSKTYSTMSKLMLKYDLNLNLCLPFLAMLHDEWNMLHTWEGNDQGLATLVPSYYT